MGEARRDIPTEDDLHTVLRIARRAATSCGANHFEADETAQSTAVRLWEKWNEPNVRAARTRGTARWHGYVRQIARNIHRDRIREHQRRIARQKKAAGAPEPGPQRPASSPVTPVCPCAVDALLGRALLADEILRLPNEQRVVAALFFLESQTVPEIATLRGVQQQSIRKHLRLARATLQRRLSEAEKLPL